MAQQGHGRLPGKKPCNHPPSFGDMDFRALPKKVFHAGKMVAEVSDAGLFHIKPCDTL